MIDLQTAYLCGAIIIVAGALEILSNGRTRMLRYSSLFCALGFILLGTRYLYLAWNNDILRLNIYGTGSIIAIALGRIIACSAAIKK